MASMRGSRNRYLSLATITNEGIESLEQWLCAMAIAGIHKTDNEARPMHRRERAPRSDGVLSVNSIDAKAALLPLGSSVERSVVEDLRSSVFLQRTRRGGALPRRGHGGCRWRERNEMGRQTVKVARRLQ